MSKFLLMILDRIQDDAKDEIKITETELNDSEDII
jgi:hypothetical protein